MTDLVSGTTGTGFLKFTGGFRIIPNFAIINWQFQFALEMPTEYFTNGNWAYFHAKVKNSDTTNEAEDEFAIVCAVEIGGKPKEAYVSEFFYASDFSSSNDVGIFDLNADQENYYAGWTSNFDKSNYSLKDSIAGKKRQTCTAMIELDKETVADMADKSYTIEIGARLFDSLSATQATAMLAPKTMSYTFPLENPTMESLDTYIRDFQGIIFDSNQQAVVTPSG